MIHSPPIDSAELLLEKLYKLERKCVFRGHSNPNYKLTPTAFRNDGIEKLSKGFPAEDEINEWIINDEILEFIKLQTKALQTNNFRIRLSQLLIHIMKINYQYCLFLKKHNMELPLDRDEEFWNKQETFTYLFQGFYPLLIKRTQHTEVILPRNKQLVIQEPKPIEDISVIDTSYPQHYGCLTSALDWTTDPLIAIYFALKEHTSNCSESAGRFHMAKKMPSEYFSIFSFKELEDTSDEGSPIKLVPNKDPKNERAIRQKGKFTLFTKPNSFYLRHGRFPSIEDYYRSNSKKFKIEKYNIRATQKNIEYLLKDLDDKKINSETLGFCTRK